MRAEFPLHPLIQMPNHRDRRSAPWRRGSLTVWFDPDMVWGPPPTGKRGRQPSFSDAAIQTRLTMKVLFGMPLRQTTGFVQSLLRLVGLDWTVPDFSTLSSPAEAERGHPQPEQIKARGRGDNADPRDA